jgi:hypothetical protein
VQKLANILCPKITKKVTDTKTDENQVTLSLEEQKRTFMFDVRWPAGVALE